LLIVDAEAKGIEMDPTPVGVPVPGVQQQVVAEVHWGAEDVLGTIDDPQGRWAVRPETALPLSVGKLAGPEAGVNALEPSLQCFGGIGFKRQYGIFDLYALACFCKTAHGNNEMVFN